MKGARRRGRILLKVVGAKKHVVLSAPPHLTRQEVPCHFLMLWFVTELVAMLLLMHSCPRPFISPFSNRPDLAFLVYLAMTSANASAKHMLNGNLKRRPTVPPGSLPESWLPLLVPPEKPNSWPQLAGNIPEKHFNFR